MTNATPTPGNDTGLPALSDIYLDTLHVFDLLTAMDDLRDRLGPESGPVNAIITCALPRMKKITDDMEKLNDKQV